MRHGKSRGHTIPRSSRGTCPEPQRHPRDDGRRQAGLEGETRGDSRTDASTCHHPSKWQESGMPRKPAQEELPLDLEEPRDLRSETVFVPGERKLPAGSQFGSLSALCPPSPPPPPGTLWVLGKDPKEVQREEERVPGPRQ